MKRASTIEFVVDGNSLLSMEIDQELLPRAHAQINKTYSESSASEVPANQLNSASKRRSENSKNEELNPALISKILNDGKSKKKKEEGDERNVVDDEGDVDAAANVP